MLRYFVNERRSTQTQCKPRIDRDVLNSLQNGLALFADVARLCLFDVAPDVLIKQQALPIETDRCARHFPDVLFVGRIPFLDRESRVADRQTIGLRLTESRSSGPPDHRGRPRQRRQLATPSPCTWPAGRRSPGDGSRRCRSHRHRSAERRPDMGSPPDRAGASSGCPHQTRARSRTGRPWS